MNIQEKSESVIIALTASICILITILDFIGALDSLPWLAQRVSIMTLLAVGLIALYLIVERNRRFRNLEKTVAEGTNQILSRISLDHTNQNIIDSINNIWNEIQPEIQNFFDQARIITEKADQKILQEYLEDVENSFYDGDFFGTKLRYPWDFNITALDYKGNFIHHHTKELISTRVSHKYPYSDILDKRTGTLFWQNTTKSHRMRALLPHPHLKTIRFTKVYFRELLHIQAIIAFEHHINILCQIPKLELLVSQKNTLKNKEN